MSSVLGHFYVFGDFRLDAEKRVLWRGGEIVPLTPKATDVLILLVESRGNLLERDVLLDKVWRDTFVEEGNLNHAVFTLRKTLGNDEIIQTVPRRGYRFTAEVDEVLDGATPDIVIERRTLSHTVIDEHETQENEMPFESWATKFSMTAVAFGILIIVFAGFVLFRYQGARSSIISSQPIRSIAVLPFRTIDSNGDGSHHGLGMADLLVTRLSAIRDINVRPINAVLPFANEERDAVRAGQELQVDAVLEGTIFRTRDNVRITARLIRVADGLPLWTGQFDRNVKDELQVQNEIALQIVNVLALNLSGDEKSSLAKRYTDDAEAYELYLKGRYHWNKRSDDGMAEAERLFRNAVAKDPNFALAYIGLADTAAMSYKTGEAVFAARKGMELDPDLAEGHATRGFIYLFHYWNWQEAEKSFRRSIELNPGYASAHHWYAELLKIQGRNDEAKTELHRALEINPLSHNFLADLGQAYYFSREFGEAEAYCQKALVLDPDFGFSYNYLYFIYLQTNDFEKAVAARVKFQQLQWPSPARADKDAVAQWAAKRHEHYELSGIRGFLEHELETVVGDPNPNAYYGRAQIQSRLGEKVNALDNLERALEGSAFLMPFVKADPEFDSIRDEPRFQAILSKMNL